MFAATMALGVASVGSTCGTSTEYFYEGQGGPTQRTTGTVPDGEIGVCRMPMTARPLLVDEKLWDHARICTQQTPARFIRLGYTPVAATNEAEALKEQERYFGTLREGEKSEGGNNQLVSLLRNLHERGLKDPLLHNRVARQTARDGVCDYSYLLNTMATQRHKLAKGEKCAAQAYDTTVRGDVCLFDTTHEETVWLTSSWSCVAHTGTLGDDTSCYRLCGYDDYCAKQVTCSAPDIDLLMCAMGVCLPEARAGF